MKKVIDQLAVKATLLYATAERFECLRDPQKQKSEITILATADSRRTRSTVKKQQFRYLSAQYTTAWRWSGLVWSGQVGQACTSFPRLPSPYLCTGRLPHCIYIV